MWDFNRPADFAPHAKVAGRYYFSPSVFVIGGWDDFLNTSRNVDSFFIGAGLRWGDDDVKYLAGSPAAEALRRGRTGDGRVSRPRALRLPLRFRARARPAIRCARD